jgi:primary-amine oxidase
VFAEDDSMPDGRIIQCFVYCRSFKGDNHYAHPLDVLVYLDMNTKKVLQILGQSKPAKVPQLNANFFTPQVVEERGVRADLKPLNIAQPQGPSFKVDGHHVTWQKWNFRVGFNYREGVTLHDIGYARASCWSGVGFGFENDDRQAGWVADEHAGVGNGKWW